MIIILGESASGKSSIERTLVNKYGFNRIISYTTRPPREGEINGIDYNFITENTFKKLQTQDFFAEVGEYRGWFYGSAAKDYTDDKVCVLTPHGLRQIKKMNKFNVISFYISISRRDRIIKMLQRGDDIEECYRRSVSDIGQFDGISDEVDFVIHNDGYKKTSEEIADEILNLIKCAKDGV